MPHNSNTGLPVSENRLYSRPAERPYATPEAGKVRAAVKIVPVRFTALSPLPGFETDF